jgi:spore maturation protein CgeB
MNILFIGSTKFDYLQDILFSGLFKKLGGKNLTTINFHKNYFLPLKSYPKNMGYEGRSILTFSPFLSNFKKFDAVIVGSAKPDAFESYHQIKHKIPEHCITVFVDGGDRPDIGEDLKRLGREELYPKATDRPFDLIFKREYLKETTYPDNVFPLPFGVNFNTTNHIKRLPPKYDVTFWAVESHPIRTKALQIIQNQYDCQSNGTKLNQNFKDYNRKGDFYLEELYRSRVVLNFRGGGWDTMRYWEAPALGCFMISQKPGIVIPDEFKDGEHLVYVKEDLSNLEELCDYYLNHKQARLEIADRAKEHTAKYHSDIARAHKVLSEIERLKQ